MSIAKRSRNDWTLQEVKILKDRYPTSMSINDIQALLPRHTEKSIGVYARHNLKLKRPKRRNNPHPGWDRIKEVLSGKTMTMQQIADSLGISKSSVSECMGPHRSEWHIADRIPRRGMHTWIIALGSGDDAPVNLCAKNLSRYFKVQPNPFLVAAGIIEPHETVSGRVFKQDMVIHLNDELEEA